MVQGKRTVWVALNKSLLVCPDEDFLLVRTRDVATALFSLFACFFFFGSFFLLSLGTSHAMVTMAINVIEDFDGHCISFGGTL